MSHPPPAPVPSKSSMEFDYGDEGVDGPSPSPNPSGLMDDPWLHTKDAHHKQYVQNGPGYKPAGASTPRLTAGLYQVAWINDQLSFVRTLFACDDLIRLPDSKSDEVIAEIAKFWTLAPVFKQYGYTHKRGFLLHGPPGSGKTATIITVIQQVIADDGIVIMGGGKIQPEHLAQMLQKFREIEPSRKLVVVLEDIDSYIKSFDEDSILAILDGEASLNGVVFIATTNYPEDLDGRITNRPSRFDRVVEIGCPSASARRTYFKSRKMGMSDESLEEWVEATEDFSIAHCKELVIAVLCLGETFSAAIDRLRGMKNAPSSSPSRPAGFGASVASVRERD